MKFKFGIIEILTIIIAIIYLYYSYYNSKIEDQYKQFYQKYPDFSLGRLQQNYYNMNRTGPNPDTLPEVAEYNKLPRTNIPLKLKISKYVLYLFLFIIVCHQAYINIIN